MTCALFRSWRALKGAWVSEKMRGREAYGARRKELPLMMVLM
jgi:hypothetical protein